ncbi:hypothetical protein ABZ883_04530 [Streptomyces sp. NPDC046977]|uniref:hypothetical protein n=1 Tax=Streptomyces sp. NPDC046977 TaxID=3154703 RepID=UPI0034061F21
MSAVYPHIGYADALHGEFGNACVAPDVMSVTVTSGQELFTTIRWDRSPALPRGLRLVWSHITGWRRDDPTTGDSQLLPVETLAAPKVIAAAAALLLTGEREVPHSEERWVLADQLARCLDAWETGDVLDGEDA